MARNATADEIETHNEYPNPVTETDIDYTTMNLYTQRQLRRSIEDIVEDDPRVIVSDRRTESVIGIERDRVSGELTNVSVSWEVFDTEETLHDAGWDVIVSALDALDALE